MHIKYLRWVTTAAVFLALCVVMLGAYTRLTDAGLGCPDWPGCYGKMALPVERDGLTEMLHRYLAGSLGCLILFILAFAPKYKLPWMLVGLVFFQAALGMWTVTLKLLPVVVMGHLLGGLLIFSLLFLFRAQLSEQSSINLSGWHKATLIGVLIIFIQIALGGWVSSNYAGIACVGFPQCNGSWLPTLQWMPAFDVFSTVGANYQGGLLDSDARVTIQFVHRLGALITATYCLGLSLFMMRIQRRRVFWLAFVVFMLIILQLFLGMMNVIYLLPLPLAVAHNGVAALLLGSMITLSYSVSGGKK